MQLALHRAERPEVFEDIIGQKQIVRILQNQIKTGTVSQAYLFAGTHGTGKTTTARILAKAVNCLEAESGKGSVPCGECDNCEAIRQGKFVDVIELDAASNNGVDDLRAIIELVKYPPTVGRYKVYIIDEVHMLSQAAENAFLKTLEEPPEYAIFILATTDPEKVRATIRSRCMQLNFKRVSEDELIAGMRRICEKKAVEVTDDALATVASKADGSVRDALSILEQCLAAGDSKLDKAMVLEYTGSAGEDFYLALTGAINRGELGKALLYIDEIIKRGKDAKQILKDWLEHYRNLLIVKYVAKPQRIIRASAENISRMKAQSDELDSNTIERAIRLISEYINIGRYSDRPRIILETVAVRLAGTNEIKESSEVGSRARVGRAARESLSPSVEASAKAKADKPIADKNNSNNVDADSEAPPERFVAGPREVSGDPDDMWDCIVEEVCKECASFGSLVGRHSAADRFENGELVIKIKKNKLAIAEGKIAEIRKCAKLLYGNDVAVNLTAGDIEPAARVMHEPRLDNAQGDNTIDTEALLNEASGEVSELFGLEPEIVEN